MSSARKAVMTSLALMVLRRRLQRQSGPTAAVALLGLELLGPRILGIRRLLAWTLALTIVGGIAVAAIWWWRRGARTQSAPEPPAEPVTVPVRPPAPAPEAA